jgi:dedicator of cytokinesis protein 3
MLDEESQLPESPSLKPAPTQYQGSLYEQSLQRSLSTSSTQRPTFVIPPLQLGRNMLTPPPQSPQSPRASMEPLPPAKQTPLQRHLAHLARHGINGLSSAPKDNNAGHDSWDGDSPRESLVHVTSNGLTNGVTSDPQSGFSAPSLASTSNLTSIGGSIRARVSRFGSLRFGSRSASNAAATQS